MNTIYCHSSEDMHHLPDGSVHLIVTSPPYNVGMGYENHDDDMPFDDYCSLLRRIWEECYRVLVDGGRICVNICNTYRTPYIPLNAYTSIDMIDIGFLMRGEFIWDKAAMLGSFRLGTFRSAVNPIPMEDHEYVLAFSKGDYSRRDKEGDSIDLRTFLASTRSVWSLKTASATRIGHPAPFPVELPRRLIQLYSFKEDVVLDPFMGSGTTALAAKELGRQYVGYEVSPEYVKLANDRLCQEMLFT